MSERTTIVIVNWNGERFLLPLLDSLAGEKVAQIIVVDNASTDGSRRILHARSEILTVLNDQNRGFGVAANQGIELAVTPYVLLLNADVQVLPGCVERLEQLLQEDSRIAVAAPQLLFADGTIQPSCRTFPSAWKKFLFLSCLDRWIASGYRLPASEHNRLQEVDQPMGAALLLRKSALDSSGLFDPDFFLYMEEVDLCERLKKQGWKIFYVPHAQAIHHAGGSSEQDWERTQTDYLRSVIRYFSKRVSRLRLLGIRLLLSAALLIRAPVMLLKGRWKQTLFYMRMSARVLALW